MDCYRRFSHVRRLRRMQVLRVVYVLWTWGNGRVAQVLWTWGDDSVATRSPRLKTWATRRVTRGRESSVCLSAPKGPNDGHTMKLTSFRDVDQVHAADMLRVGLVDEPRAGHRPALTICSATQSTVRPSNRQSWNDGYGMSMTCPTRLTNVTDGFHTRPWRCPSGSRK
jgi:hypothetical protein